MRKTILIKLNFDYTNVICFHFVKPVLQGWKIKYKTQHMLERDKPIISEILSIKLMSTPLS